MEIDKIVNNYKTVLLSTPEITYPYITVVTYTASNNRVGKYLISNNKINVLYTSGTERLFSIYNRSMGYLYTKKWSILSVVKGVD